MNRPSLRAIVVACGILWAAPVGAQNPSEQICALSTAFLAKKQLPIQNGMLLAIDGSGSGDLWKSANPPSYGPTDPNNPQLTVSHDRGQVSLAYFMTQYYPSTGAILAKVSVQGDAKTASNYVDVYRPAIARGANRCEPRGRATVERRVRVNEYIDYHDPNAGGLSSTLEDFHFSYPTGTNQCAQTNDSATIRTFQFDGVTRTQGDSFISRNFSIVGTAFAITHSFSILRAELHYRANVDAAGTCVGFVLPLSGYHSANFVINELGFGSSPVPKAWLISH